MEKNKKKQYLEMRKQNMIQLAMYLGGLDANDKFVKFMEALEPEEWILKIDENGIEWKKKD